MTNSRTVNGMVSAADDITTALAAYDLEIRGLDLPGVPDIVWEKLTGLTYNLEQMYEEMSYKYEDLDFNKDEYYEEPDENGDEEEDT